MIKHLCDICKKEINSAGICVGEVKVQGTREHYQSVASFIGKEVCPVCIDKILTFIEGMQQKEIQETKECKTKGTETWFEKETATRYIVRCPKCRRKPIKNRWNYEVLTPYCPWCGADLRKRKRKKKGE